jgi:uncharacterized protein
MTPELAKKEQALEQIIKTAHRLLIAFSGGVDSSYLLWKAHKILGLDCMGVIADSPSLARSELHHAIAFAEKYKLPLIIVPTNELDDPVYRANPVNRCYYCKHALFHQLTIMAIRESFHAIAYGENADDMLEFRPGQQAAEDFQILAPLREAGLTKAEIRKLASRAHLSIAEKAAQPCLASRIPHGQPVTAIKLRRVEAAEKVLHDFGFRIARVRHDKKTALVQVAPQELDRLKMPETSALVAEQLLKLGFEDVAIDPHGYKGASLK